MLDNCHDCGGLEPIPICSQCGDCADCIEPEIVVVRRLPILNSCDWIADAVKDTAGNAQEPCTVKINSITVIGKTVTIVPQYTSYALEYSLNGESWQVGPTFTNQPCGNNKYYVRQRNYPACVASSYATVNTGCECVPVWVLTNPLVTQCINGFVNNKRQDGCGNFDFVPTTTTCGGCVPNVVDVSPQETRCINNKVEIRTYDGCGVFGWRQTQTACGTVECLPPTIPFGVSTTPATCDSLGFIQNDASFTFGPVSGADKYGFEIYDVDSDGPTYAGATVLPSNNIIVKTGLTGYTVTVVYLLRIFNGANDCFIDKYVPISGTICSPCVTPVYSFTSVAPTCTGNVSSANGIVRLSSISSATKYQLCQDTTFTCTPNYSSATAISGSGPINMLSNISFLTDQPYKDYSVRVYNGSQGCYLDKYLRFTNPCYNGSSCVNPIHNNPTTVIATCTGTTPNNDAIININGIVNADKYAYSVGTVYSGANYGSAITISSGTISITGLTGSVNATSYVVRLFNNLNECYTDIPVTVAGKTCTVACVVPTFTTKGATEATCTGTVPNNDAHITITGITNGTRFGYALGSSYAGPAYASANNLTTGTIAITNIPGNASATTYTFRIWNGAADCFTDVTQIVPGKSCPITCVIPSFTLSVTPPTCTADVANYDGVLKINSGWTNGTRYQVCIDSTFSCGNQYDDAPAMSGSGEIIVLNDQTFFSGETSKTYFIRVYNGSASCYETHSIVMTNGCTSCCSLAITGITLTDI